MTDPSVLAALSARTDVAEAAITQIRADIAALAGQPTPTPAPTPTPTPVARPGRPQGFAYTMQGLVPVLTWQTQADAATFELDDAANTADPVKATGLTGTSNARSPLKPGETRLYVLYAVSKDGVKSLPSDTLTVTYGKTPNPTPTPSPTPSPSPTPTPGGKRYPTDVIPNLARGTITLPTGTQGDPDNLFLIGKEVPDVFYVGADGGVVFQANAGGVHTEHSHFCRCEWRQMLKPNLWTPPAGFASSSPNSMTCVLSLDNTKLDGRPRIVGMQIHDASDDICQLMLHETMGLGFMYDGSGGGTDANRWTPVDPHYVPGTKVTVAFAVANDQISVSFNDAHVLTQPSKGSGWYFKTGAYLQDDVPTYKASPSATGKVVLYSLDLTGTGQ